MLQNPSKYHPNPLSHFLALHQPQAAHTTPVLRTNLDQQNHVEQQQQTYRHPSAQLTVSDHHNRQQNQHYAEQHLNASHTQLMDANSTIDAGKSFTIAAILGLQKNAVALECSHKDHNNVINLSLHSSTGHSYHSSPNHHKGEMMEKHSNAGNMHGNASANTAAASGLHTFNCDTNAALSIGRFLPKTNSSTSFGANSSSAAQMHVNNFAAAAAVAAAVNVGAAPSALQSLQQLHQHHAQQNNLSFHRDRQKSDISCKKSSLKNKRVRTIFTPEQLERLESEFERQQYMVGPERLYLAHTLQLTEAQVKVWFQNRRIKWRKHHLEITQQRLALLRQSQLSVTPGPHRTATTPTCSDEADDVKNTDSLADVTSESRQASESDLSICNDSVDAESYADADET